MIEEKDIPSEDNLPDSILIGYCVVAMIEGKPTLATHQMFPPTTSGKEAAAKHASSCCPSCLPTVQALRNDC